MVLLRNVSFNCKLVSIDNFIHLLCSMGKNWWTQWTLILVIILKCDHC